MNVQPYNFAQPGRLPGDIGQRLATWLRAASALAGRRWAKHLPFTVEVSAGTVEARRAEEVLAALPGTATGFRVAAPPDGQAMMLVLARPLILALTAGMLGETPTALPEDRDLTTVEESLWEHLARSLLLPLLQDTWMGPQALALELGPAEPNPKWSRLFPPDDLVVTCPLHCKAPFGQADASLLMALKAIPARLARPEAKPAGPAPEVMPLKPRLEALVQQMPVEACVTLGTVELSLAQLAQLRPGDVLILNQRITEPLTAAVAGARKFRGWAGRVGSRQAFQIESLTDG